MRNQHQHQHQHRHQHQQQQLYHHIRNSSGSFFFPILCKLSIKDVKFPNPSSSGDNNLNEPSSPKVSCMGQVKRNNKVIGFPTPCRPTTALSGPLNPKVKYTKLKKLFSGKNFTAGNNRELKTSVTVTVTVGGSTKSAISDKAKIIKEAVEVINVSELDPPLPVVKKVKPPPEDGGLWKRRSGGVALTSLQIHLPTHNNLLQQPTTV